MSGKSFIFWLAMITIVVISALIIYRAGPPADEPEMIDPALPDLSGPALMGYTHVQPDGNRVISGTGSFPVADRLDIHLDGKPRWVAAASLDNGSIWAAVLEDGYVQAFTISDDTAREIIITPDRLPSGMPPLLLVENGSSFLVIASSTEASLLTHPVVLNKTGRLAFIENGGDLVIWDEKEIARLSLNALPDARLLVDEHERILLLTGPTTRYDHGVLGDEVEASGLALIQTTGTPQVILNLTLPAPAVIEGIAPLWTDLDEDGDREIIVTVSDVRQGAQLLVFDETGDRIAAGPPTGQGYRWRHQLAVASFGPGDERELAAVLTPHIGGVVEFFRLEGGELIITARQQGYSSHVIGSRNLDMAAARSVVYPAGGHSPCRRRCRGGMDRIRRRKNLYQSGSYDAPGRGCDGGGRAG